MKLIVYSKAAKEHSFIDYCIDANFPNAILLNKISQATSMKGELYITLTRLKNELNRIPNILLDKKYNYLLNKVNKLSGKYNLYKSF
jgi:hypothetical protein